MSGDQSTKILFIGSSHLDRLHYCWNQLDDVQLSNVDFVSCSEIAWRAIGNRFEASGTLVSNEHVSMKELYETQGVLPEGFEPLGSIHGISFEPDKYAAIVIMDGSFWQGSYQCFIGSTSSVIKVAGVPLSDDACFDLDIVGLGRFPTGAIPLPYRLKDHDDVMVASGFSPGFDLGQFVALIKFAAPKSHVYVHPTHMPFAETLPHDCLDPLIQIAIDTYTQLSQARCHKLGVKLLTINEALISPETRHTELKYSAGMLADGQWDTHLNADFYKIQIPHILNEL